MSRKLALTLRILTAPQVLAAALAILLRIFLPGEISLFHCLMMILFLTVIPCAAYPVSAVITSIGKGGRKTQRSIAVVLSVAGYVAGTLFALFAGGGRVEKIVYLTYLISGATVAVCSFLFKFKVSGHACGAAGPVAALTVFCSPWFFLGAVLLPVVYRASVSIKRHDLTQLAAGTLAPLIALYIASRIF